MMCCPLPVRLFVILFFVFFILFVFFIFVEFTEIHRFTLTAAHSHFNVLYSANMIYTVHNTTFIIEY